mgnify:CR=1
MESVDYAQSYSNTPPEGKEMSRAEAARKWAAYLKKFEALRKRIKVEVY